MEKKMAVYRVKAAAFLVANPICQACALVRPNLTAGEKAILFGRHVEAFPSTEVHHLRGRHATLLLNDKFWRALCRSCHAYVGLNPAWSREVGLLCQRGEWGKQL